MFCETDDKEFATLVAENRLVTDIQLEIEHALDALNLTQAELAKLADISEARVSQILSGNGKNLQARTIARLAHALGMRARIEFADRNQNSNSLLSEMRDEKPDFKTWLDATVKRQSYAANDDELVLMASA